jgi:hypothetical protein
VTGTPEHAVVARAASNQPRNGTGVQSQDVVAAPEVERCRKDTGARDGERQPRQALGAFASGSRPHVVRRGEKDIRSPAGRIRRGGNHGVDRTGYASIRQDSVDDAHRGPPRLGVSDGRRCDDGQQEADEARSADAFPHAMNVTKGGSASPEAKG